MRKWLVLGVAAILMISFSACGDNDAITGPGFVGIDDSTADTAPLLTVDYVDAFGQGRARILSDPLSDGDIAFDPVRSVFTIETGVSPLFFGIYSPDRNLPELRTFLTFPLDGFGGRQVVPSGATITSATVELFITDVRYAGTVPTFLDLVPYGFRDLVAQDFDAPFIDFRSLDFFSSDRGNFVLIDVTPLMQTAQDRNLLDFQVRFSVDQGASVAGVLQADPRGAPKKAGRTAGSSSVEGNRPAR